MPKMDWSATKKALANRYFSQQELRDIALRLEVREAVFAQLWSLGKARYTTEVDTAAVSFDRTGQCLELMVNPKFWESKTPVQRDWIICHEMLHVILAHGARAKDQMAVNQPANNTAMDIVVNELCVSGFGFKKDEIDPKREFIWLENTFPNRTDILPGQTYEYYLNNLPKSKMPMVGDTGGKKGSGAGKILDDHSNLPADEDMEKMAEEVAKKLSDEERERFAEKLGQEKDEAEQAGDEAGGFVRTMDRPLVSRKKKWEGLIKHFLKQMLEEGMHESWVQPNRRLMAVNGSGGHSEVILPAEVMTEGKEKKRALVYMFLDTSGSCANLADRFWRLAATVPRDKFDLRLRCFDTKVYEVDLKDRKLYGFGGTRFGILERHVQAERNGGPYPDGVFMVTDGYGDTIRPEFPDRWHVLLTPNGEKDYLDKKMHVHDLRNFE